MFKNIKNICIVLLTVLLIFLLYQQYRLSESINDINKDTIKKTSRTGEYEIIDEGAAGGLFFVENDSYMSINIKIISESSYHTCDFFSACEKKDGDIICNEYTGDGSLGIKFDNDILEVYEIKNIRDYCGMRMGLDGTRYKIKK